MRLLIVLPLLLVSCFTFTTDVGNRPPVYYYVNQSGHTVTFCDSVIKDNDTALISTGRYLIWSDIIVVIKFDSNKCYTFNTLVDTARHGSIDIRNPYAYDRIPNDHWDYYYTITSKLYDQATECEQ